MVDSIDSGAKRLQDDGGVQFTRRVSKNPPSPQPLGRPS
jgi:hypothetical protein